MIDKFKLMYIIIHAHNTWWILLILHIVDSFRNITATINIVSWEIVAKCKQGPAEPASCQLHCLSGRSHSYITEACKHLSTYTHHHMN